jgi:L-asparaginase
MTHRRCLAAHGGADAGATARPSRQGKKPKVVILATGGTIAGSAASRTEAGYQSGRGGRGHPDQGGAAAQGRRAEVSGEQIASIGSQDMNDAVWLKLASA